jgi:hypothetical protein
VYLVKLLVGHLISRFRVLPWLFLRILGFGFVRQSSLLPFNKTRYDYRFSPLMPEIWSGEIDGGVGAIGAGWTVSVG